MFTNFKIKQEIVDQSYEQNSHQVIDNCLNYGSSLVTIDDLKLPPKKRIKVEEGIRDPRILKHICKDTENTETPQTVPKVEFIQQVDWEPEVDYKPEPNDKPEVHHKPEAVHKRESEDKEKKSISSFKPVVNNKSFLYSKSLSPTLTLYENVLQEIFQWSPEWLQGSVSDKPPLLKFEQQMRQNGFKYEYNREEYISRHLPYILRGLFIKLSDTFKNEAPSRSEHFIYINDCENTGHSQLNRQMVCYSVRDIRKNRKPLIKVNDVVILSVNFQTSDGKVGIDVMTGKMKAKKKYFGIISSHSMLETSDMNAQVVNDYQFLTNSKFDKESYDYLLWDRLTILTKRAQNSVILPKVLAKMDILLNASFELRLIKNLLDRSSKCSKLLSNILCANGNVHQFSAEELEDSRSVRKTLSKNANEMITKSNPMVFFKGINNLMVIDISDTELRFKYLCDIAVEAILKTVFAKLRVLVITSSDTMNENWLKRLKMISKRSCVRPWYVDDSRGWTRHMDVIRYVNFNAKKICNSVGSKLKQLKRESDEKTFRELIKRKAIYKEIEECHKSIPCPFMYNTYRKTSAFLIANEELNDKGLEQSLNDSNVIIGTFYDILNCHQLFNDKSKPFDCCIVDDSHLLSDAFIMSIIHLGINTMIIGGDSDQSTDLSEDPIAMDNKYNISLFERIIGKCLKF